MSIDWWKPWIWLILTLICYLASRWLYKRKRHSLLSPIIIVPIVLFSVAIPLHVSYSEYSQNTHWLVSMLGPATVAFAIPIWNKRKIIAEHWLSLLIGMLVGSTLSVVSSIVLAKAFALDEQIALSLFTHSISMPFAIPVSQSIGAIPGLAALFVLITGVLGAIIGGVFLKWLPHRSVLTKGAVLGVGAHAVGVTRAHEFGESDGTIASLAMILMGLLNILLVPLIHLVL